MVRKSFRLHHKAAVRKKTAARRPSFRVEVTKVDPRVWALAKELAEGDMSRIVVESETSVLVVNPKENR